jgi:polysaccharide biosynthesis/export protein
MKIPVPQPPISGLFAVQKLFILIFLAILPFFLLCGCSGNQKKSDEALVQSYAAPSNPTNDDISQLNEKIFASSSPSGDLSDYIIGTGDLMEVTVFESDQLNTEVRVSSRGYVTLPLLDQVMVKGLSAMETEETIEMLYKEKYIRNPHVSIFVKERYSQRVTLVGEVETPGTYDYVTKMRLLDVLALAGGLTAKAGTTLQVRRVGEETNDQNVFIVDLDRLIKRGDTNLNVEINGGDVVYVPEAGAFFVDGAVRRPGSYTMKQETVLQEALLSAGGLQPYADKDHVAIVRLKDDGDREIIELNLEENPAAINTPILDRDVIIAKGSSWGKILQGTGLNLGILGFGIRYDSPEE